MYMLPETRCVSEARAPPSRAHWSTVGRRRRYSRELGLEVFGRRRRNSGRPIRPEVRVATLVKTPRALPAPQPLLLLYYLTELAILYASRCYRISSSDIVPNFPSALRPALWWEIVVVWKWPEKRQGKKREQVTLMTLYYTAAAAAS